jgi:hypothetical protein
MDTKSLDTTIRDFLRNNLVGNYGIESDIQVIATAESQPMDFPFVVVSITGFDREYESTQTVRTDYNVSIGIVDRWVDSRELYEKNADLIDSVIDTMENDHEVNETFNDTLVTSAEFTTVTAESEQGTMPFGQIELSVDAWRMEPS